MRPFPALCILSVAVLAWTSRASAQDDGPPAGEPPPPAASSRAAEAATPVVALAPSTGAGIAPAVLSEITQALRESATRRGYVVLDEQHCANALATIPERSVESAADLWRFMHSAGASLALVAHVHSAPGYFVIRIELANADGSGPFSASTGAHRAELRGAVEQLVPRVLTPAPPASVPGTATTPTAPGVGAAAASGHAPLPARAPETVEPEFGFWRLVAQSEVVLGVYESFFYNQLVGGRVDMRFARRLSLGAYGAYVNLKGRTGRENSALIAAQLDYRIDLGTGRIVQATTRASTGYFVLNGPMLRAAAGLAFAVGKHEIAVDLLAPTFWIARNRTAISMDLALEVAFQL